MLTIIPFNKLDNYLVKNKPKFVEYSCILRIKLIKGNIKKQLI